MEGGVSFDWVVRGKAVSVWLHFSGDPIKNRGAH
jgi:hypothetical protein